MKCYLSILLLLIAMLACVAIPMDSHSQTRGAGTVQIEIVPVFNGAPVKLAEQYYVDEHGDTLYIDLFRFYITNIAFGKTGAANSHLFDLGDTTTYTFEMPAADINSILQFTLGVDSVLNTSGANDGDLDPVKGMYWAWNSGYIMAKLEGHSQVCHTLHHAFEFHIGGYMPPYNTARDIMLQLPQPGSPFIKKIIIKADIAAWFSGGLDLSKTNSITIPGKGANAMADRYAKMFSIDKVVYAK